MDYNEKKKNVFLIGADDILSCFDLASNQYIIRQPFNETVLSMSHCPSMNLIAISFPNRVCIYSKIKNKQPYKCRNYSKWFKINFVNKNDNIIFRCSD